MHTVMGKSIALLMGLLPLIIAPAIGADMQYPDFEAQWRNPTAGRGGNPWDPGKPMGLAQQAPLTPQYQAIFETSLKEQKAGGQGNSLGSTCTLPGMPKMMNLSEPMEIVIRPQTTYFIPMQYPTRRIYTDGRDWPADEPPTFGGYSIGKWIDEDGDGRYDALEVETRGPFKGPRVYDASGLPLHHDNQSIIKERIHLDKADRNLLHDEITVLDHALTRPWTVDKRFLRNLNPRPQWPEYGCEGNSQIKIGNEFYFLSADGLLMPTRHGQPAPDLRYFKQSRK